MNRAEAIVNVLLENHVQACAACQKEFGVQSSPGESHGYCKRHLIDMYGQMIALAQKNKNQGALRNAHNRIAEIQARPDSEFPPDLSQRQGSAAVAQ